MVVECSIFESYQRDRQSRLFVRSFVTFYTFCDGLTVFLTCRQNQSFAVQSFREIWIDRYLIFNAQSTTE